MYIYIQYIHIIEKYVQVEIRIFSPGEKLETIKPKVQASFSQPARRGGRSKLTKKQHIYQNIPKKKQEDYKVIR